MRPKAHFAFLRTTHYVLRTLHALYSLSMTAIVFGLFGLIVGSFLNVIILRHGVRSIGGRSGCMSCGARLPWYDIIPIFSWLALGGRCRACRARISMHYPLVEAATGALFALVGASLLPFPQKILGCVVVSLLVAIATYDLKHTIIPDRWVWSFNALAFVFASAFPWPLTLPAGPLVAFPLFALWLFSRGLWMGLGDAKLTLGIGWLLGPALGLLALFGAFVIGAVVSLLLVFISSDAWKKVLRKFIPHHSWSTSGAGLTMKSEIPFGPFLISSCIIIWFASLYGIDSLRVFGLLLW